MWHPAGMRPVTVEERRARLGHRHLLAPAHRAASPAGAAEAVVGLHSTDPSSVYLAARARMTDPAVDAVEAALYDERTVVRILGMRRTMFVVPVSLFPLLQHGCADALVARERRRNVKLLEDQEITDDGAAWMERVEAATLEALDARGEAVASELSEDVPELRERLSFGEGKKWAGTMGMSTRVLFLLATSGRILRGRPRGSWISSQYRWVTTRAWIGDLPEPIPAAEARRRLVERWLLSYGPGTFDDVKWWTGWTVTQTRAALEAAGAVEVELDEGAGLVHSSDADPDANPAGGCEPWAALLPALDSTTMGWTHRDWYLGELAPRLFDRNGNAGPTVWWNGRIVGGWAQRPDGEVAVRLLEDVGDDARRFIDDEAGALQEWLGDTRVTPRFRTPLEKELSS